MKTSRRSRCYSLTHHANSGKLDAIRDMLPVWQSGLVHVQVIQVRRLKAGLPLLWLTKNDMASLSPMLSQRQWKSVTNQVNGALRSWQELAKINVRHRIHAQKFDTQTRVHLYAINARAAWWSQEPIEYVSRAGEKIAVPQNVMGIARKLIRESLQDVPFPNLGRVRTMLMDSPIAAMENSKTRQHERWIRIATLRRGKPVVIPVNSSAYFLAKPGEEAGVTQVAVSKNGDVTFRRIKQSQPAPLRPATGKTLGLDWGLSSLFATSSGRLLGRKFLRQLQRYDQHIVTLVQRLQRNSIKPRDSRRYRLAVSRVKAFLHNEIGRILNRVASDPTLSRIAVESLDFRDGGMSRRMNRLISNCGRSMVQQKLAALTEDCGIIIESNSPSYTSQQCSGCGFTDKTNRKSQSRFTCGFCGKKVHADINAARNIQCRRSALGADNRWIPRSDILTILDRQFCDQWATEPGRYRQRQHSGNSTAARQLAVLINENQ